MFIEVHGRVFKEAVRPHDAVCPPDYAVLPVSGARCLVSTHG